MTRTTSWSSIEWNQMKRTSSPTILVTKLTFFGSLLGKANSEQAFIARIVQVVGVIVGWQSTHRLEVMFSPVHIHTDFVPIVRAEPDSQTCNGDHGKHGSNGQGDSGTRHCGVGVMYRSLDSRGEHNQMVYGDERMDEHFGLDHLEPHFEHTELKQVEARDELEHQWPRMVTNMNGVATMVDARDMSSHIQVNTLQWTNTVAAASSLSSWSTNRAKADKRGEAKCVALQNDFASIYTQQR